MDLPDPQFDLADLCQQAGVTARTVRYYIQQGLLPQPGPGRDARKYGPATLNRLKLIRQLQRSHLPLAEIRQRLAGLSDLEVGAALTPDAPAVPSGAVSARDYIAQVLGAPPEQAPSGTSRSSWPVLRAPAAQSAPASTDAPPAGLPPSAPAALDPAAQPEAWPRLREQWERLRLHDDIELHIRRPASRELNRRIERLLEVARRILNDDP
jgi:DNA-binding transcriptional MerR regulator